MTNLLFSILTVLVTNVSESVHPQSPYGIVLPMNPPIYQHQPKTKSVHKTCERITNRVDTLTGTPITVELGRALVWSTTENFTQVTEWKSSGVVTNEIPSGNGRLTGTNGYSYGIQWNSNAFRGQSLIFSNAPVHGNTVSNLAILTNSYTLELP